MKWLTASLISVTAALVLGLEAGHGAILVWADASDNTIKTANDDRTNVATLLTAAAETIAVDPVSGKVFWANRGSSIYRANLADGSNIEELYSSGETVRELAVDVRRGHLYWVDQGDTWPNPDSTDGVIRRSALNGTGVTNVVTGIIEPYGIDLDVAGEKVYWTSGTTPGGTDRIQRANLDGSGVEDLLLTGGRGVHGIALDLLNSDFYAPVTFDDAPYSQIQRADFDGDSADIVISSSGDKPANWRSIAVDSIAGKVYFQEQQTGGGILRTNLNGTELEDVVSTGIPRGIDLVRSSSTVIPEPVSLAVWSVLAFAGFIISRSYRRHT